MAALETRTAAMFRLFSFSGCSRYAALAPKDRARRGRARADDRLHSAPVSFTSRADACALRRAAKAVGGRRAGGADWQARNRRVGGNNLQAALWNCTRVAVRDTELVMS